MSNLQWAFSSFGVLVLLYLVRSMRALHRKVGRQNERIHNGLQKIQHDAKNFSVNDYRQLEAFIQLNSLLKFTAPIPSTRGWAGSPDLLLTIYQLVKSLKPKNVVELGSGVSTLVLAKSGARKVISFDGSAEYAQKTRDLLKAHAVRGVDVRTAELAPYKGGSLWYATEEFKDLKSIDFLLIDGPQSGDDNNARYPALEMLIGKLTPKAIIVLDDVNRPGERKLAEDFAKALPRHQLTILSHEKGTAIISPR